MLDYRDMTGTGQCSVQPTPAGATSRILGRTQRRSNAPDGLGDVVRLTHVIIVSSSDSSHELEPRGGVDDVVYPYEGEHGIDID